MATDNDGNADVLARLAKLETQNRRFKQAAAIAVLAGAALLAMAQTRPPGVVNATRFNLLGPDGSTAAFLGYAKGAVKPALIFGRQGGTHLPSSTFSSDGMLALGTGGIVELLAGEKPIMGFFGKRGTNVTILGGPDQSISIGSGKGAFEIAVPASGIPSLTLNDADGFETDIGGTNLVTPSTGEKYATSAASIVMFGKGKKVIWQAPH